jgi:hypothetical protein
MSNILPQKQIARLNHLYRTRFMVVVFFVTAVIFFVGGAFLLPSLYYAREDHTQLLAQRAELDKLETGTYRESLQASVSDINNRLQIFGAGAPRSPVIGSFVGVVLSAKTPNVHIERMLIDVKMPGDTSAPVQVQGVADTREALLYFANTLRGYSGVSHVEVPIDTYIRNTNVPFTITATVTLQ